MKPDTCKACGKATLLIRLGVGKYCGLCGWGLIPPTRIERAKLAAPNSEQAPRSSLKTKLTYLLEVADYPESANFSLARERVLEALAAPQTQWIERASRRIRQNFGPHSTQSWIAEILLEELSADPPEVKKGTAKETRYDRDK